MGHRLAIVLAAISAIAMLVAVPVGIAIGLALAYGHSVTGALTKLSLRLELMTACAWAALFLALHSLSTKYALARRFLRGTVVFLLAIGCGIFGFYRIEPSPGRIVFSLQYGLLVFLAFWLFDFLASWLPTRTDAQRR